MSKTTNRADLNILTISNDPNKQSFLDYKGDITFIDTDDLPGVIAKLNPGHHVEVFNWPHHTEWTFVPMK